MFNQRRSGIINVYKEGEIMGEGICHLRAYFFSFFVARTKKGFYETLSEEIVSKIGSGKILDVGTGPGCLPIEIAKRSLSLEIVGVDMTQAFINMAQKSAAQEGVGNRVTFAIRNAYDLKFEDASFDMAVSTGVFHHLKDPTKALNEIYRVLKPGGAAWIYDLIRDASAKELILGLKQMRLPLLPWMIAIRFHGLKYEQYVNNGMAQAIRESRFKEYTFKKRNFFMEIELHKLR